MGNRKENIYDKLAFSSKIWAILLCAVIIFQLSDVPPPIIIYTGGMIGRVIFAISLAFLIFLGYNRYSLISGCVCVLLAILILIIGFFEPIRIINNPFTSQKFASSLNTNFLGKGSITYYRRIGFILFSPKTETTESGEIMGDYNFLTVSSNEIFVSSTFDGPGTEYKFENNQIDMRGENIYEYSLRKETYTSSESIKLTKDLLQYQKKSRQLTAAEYKQLRSELERMELVERADLYNQEKDEYSYELSVKIRNDTSSYYAYVDGEKQFELLYDFINYK